MTNELPKRIWAEVNEFGVDLENPEIEGYWSLLPEDGGREYIRADHALALVAATTAEIRNQICKESSRNCAGTDYDEGLLVAYRIVDRTDTDAQAALEAVKREARNEALAEAWSISDQNGDVKTATDLQKIITEDHSDE